MNEKNGWIAVDLDGTLAEYDRFIAPDVIGKPVPKMVARVRQWIGQGRTVQIFTARVNPALSAENAKVARLAIRKWLVATFPLEGKKLDITFFKHPYVVEFWDDRAVRVEKNTGEIAGPPKGLR